MKKWLIAVMGMVALALLTAVYLWGPSSMPAGQEALTTLSSANVGEFAAAFDRDMDAARLVLLLSPT